jgi:quercetin 2,3-dioxygenase
MTIRSVAQLIHATPQLEGEGMIVTRPFPTARLDHLDPFLLLDRMGPVTHAPGEAKGAPDHPHRGFETVTYVLEGGRSSTRTRRGTAAASGPETCSG